MYKTLISIAHKTTFYSLAKAHELPEMPTRTFGPWSRLWFLSLVVRCARAVATESEYHRVQQVKTLKSHLAIVPSAASFYVSNLPGLHQDPTNPLQIYAGHILSDPNASSASELDVLAHLFFVMVKARREADKQRLMFWFNVSSCNAAMSPPRSFIFWVGWARVLVF